MTTRRLVKSLSVDEWQNCLSELEKEGADFVSAPA
jgi:hypothetical protein